MMLRHDADARDRDAYRRTPSRFRYYASDTSRMVASSHAADKHHTARHGQRRRRLDDASSVVERFHTLSPRWRILPLLIA